MKLLSFIRKLSFMDEETQICIVFIIYMSPVSARGIVRFDDHHTTTFTLTTKNLHREHAIQSLIFCFLIQFISSWFCFVYGDPLLVGKVHINTNTQNEIWELNTNIKGLSLVCLVLKTKIYCVSVI